MRVLEFLVALLIVAALGVLAAVVMPGSGQVERSLVIGKDMRQVYDVLDNYRRLPDYAVLSTYDPQTQYTYSGQAFGPGAQVSWTSNDPKVGNGALKIVSAEPSFDKIDSNTQKASIVWNLDNSWRGMDKHFTIDLARQGSRGQLTNVTWAYDVSYGWNLVNRFANLYIHGDPDSFIQYSLNNLQNVLAGIANVDYSQLMPSIVQTQQAPVLLLSASTPRKDGIDGLDTVVTASVAQLQAEAKKLGVNVTGPQTLFITNYGDQTFDFEVALPIDSSTLSINGQTVQLTAPTPPALGAPAEAGSAAGADSTTLDAGSTDSRGRVVVAGNIRGMLAFGGAALKGVWNGTFAGVPQTRDMLKAYAQTHGYTFDDVSNPVYDVTVSPEVKDDSGNITAYAKHDVYLPLSSAPPQTPEQEAGLQPPAPEGSEPAAASSAPAAAGTAAAPAGSASSGS
jgi:hypothetical protein